ncbi:hypothetical protein GCM10027418_20940 [Mariniluteicoccus endophyticus]
MQVFDIPTRWADQDVQSHVNSATFVEYLQEARTELLLSGPNAHMLGGGVVVTGHQVEYLRQVLHGQDVQARVCVDQLGAARFSLAYDIVADGEVALRARTVLCPFDFEAQAVRRLTPAERDHFAALQDDVEPLRDLPRIAGVGDQGAYVHPLRVRWGDLDAYGHVNNVRAYEYIQEARIAMMAGSGKGHMWLVVRQDVDYVSQMEFRREPYSARCAVTKMGNTSMTIGCDVVDDPSGTVFHRSRTVLVCGDREGRPAPIPETVRDRLAPWVV